MSQMATRHKRCVTAHTKRLVAARAGWRCQMCGEMLDATFHVDHIVPLFEGGTNDVDNLQCLDVKCHARKTMMEDEDRVRARRAAARSRTKRPPLSCVRCHSIVSPFFAHVCRA